MLLSRISNTLRVRLLLIIFPCVFLVQYFPAIGAVLPCRSRPAGLPTHGPLPAQSSQNAAMATSVGGSAAHNSGKAPTLSSLK